MSWILYCDHITPNLFAIYWLPIHEHIRFKLVLLMNKALQNHLLCFTCLLWSHHAALLEAATFSAQHLLESMTFLASALSGASGHLLSPVPPYRIAYLSHILCIRNSLTNSKLETYQFSSAYGF